MFFSRSRYKLKKRLPLVLVFVGIIFFGGYFFIYQPLLRVRTQVVKVKKAATKLKAVFAENNIDLLEKQYHHFSETYNGLEKEAKALYWLNSVPILGAYTKDLQDGIEGGRSFIEAGRLSIETIKPYADLIGFKKGSTSFIQRPAEERLQTAVLTLDKVLPKIDSISEKIGYGEDKIKAINSKRYPKKIGNLDLRLTIENIQEQVEGASSLFVSAKPLLKELPTIMGKDKTQTYLIIFQNDKELRATGGFITAYAIFKIDKGKITIDKSEDIYSLDNSISSHPKAPLPILKYHLNVKKFYIRDSNLSPDFPHSIAFFNSLYKKSSERTEYDGVIAIDSQVLVDMLKIFGDTEVDGVRFSAKKDPRCNCPQVIYKLSDMVDRPTPYLRANRKGVLGDLMYALFYKAIGFSPSRYWGALAQTMFKNLEEKHILLYFTDKATESSVASLGFAGEIKSFDGDYLHINDVNFAGAKSNMFVSEAISSETTINAEGDVKRKLIITYRNPYKHSDCSLERGGLCLNATLRDWLRVYVPQGSKLINFAGSEKKVNVYNKLGKTVFEGFLKVYPQGMAKVAINYTLPSRLAKKTDYKLLIQKQPGTGANKLTVKIDGRTKFQGTLIKDRLIDNR